MKFVNIIYMNILVLVAALLGAFWAIFGGSTPKIPEPNCITYMQSSPDYLNSVIRTKCY